ncbi:SDR family NAD(P)-dependent oxidoreductase [Hydrogenophaga sp.]|uniref:SDR family NAD(P)-dependent oxidoreductase n=1 Tax=Hydrogenophaga sp. TaxID=1904254 RepID=UPI0035655B04
MSGFDLTGKVAMVTGGGRGIGRAISEALATHGATVVVCGRNTAPMQETVDAITQSGGRAALMPADVSDETDAVRLRDLMTAQYGGLDILVNNAGIDPHYASMEETDRSDWDRIIGVNLTGVFNCCRHLGALMIARKGGSIINISSIAGRIGLKRQVPYGASKGGVEQLTKSLAHDWAEHGIRVNAIAYGFVETDLTAGMVAHPHIAPRLLARIPMGRFGRVDEVHGAAVFLASSASSYVTGHSLLVDGGWTAA